MVVKPIVNYIGSKARMYKKLDNYMPVYIENYYEPFVGGGSVLMYIKDRYNPRECYINDIDTSLINIYKTIRDKPKELMVLLSTLDMDKSKEEFFRQVERYNNDTTEDVVDRCATYIYLRKMSFNSNFHYRGEARIKPYYSDLYKSRKIFDEKTIKMQSDILKNTQIYNEDYTTFIENVMPKLGDFVFIDPPYTVKGVNEYYIETIIDYSELKSTCDRLDENGVMFMITMNDDKDVREIFKDYIIHSIKKHSNLSQKRGCIENEIVIVNYEKRTSG